MCRRHPIFPLSLNLSLSPALLRTARILRKIKIKRKKKRKEKDPEAWGIHSPPPPLKHRRVAPKTKVA